ncbi:MAG: MipA/OmpV family protein [Thermoanaerobaculia bacterium]|nr:MipA/OmpV family protein [Thermoanaerobaculia bacterium]
MKLWTCAVLLPLTAMSAHAGTWSVGLGAAVAPSPFVGAEDFQLQPIPFVAYESKKFNFAAGEAGFELFGGEQWSLELTGMIRFEGFDREQSTALSGFERRDPALDLGFNFGFETAFGMLEAQALVDVSGVHEGQEASLAWRVPLGSERVMVAPGAGVVWKSQALVDYYYGVRAQEATAEYAEYEGRAATNVFVSVLTTLQFSDRLWLLADLNVQQLDDPITSSPIVDVDHQVSGMVGLLYRFGGSDAPKWRKP